MLNVCCRACILICLCFCAVFVSGCTPIFDKDKDNFVMGYFGDDNDSANDVPSYFVYKSCVKEINPLNKKNFSFYSNEFRFRVFNYDDKDIEVFVDNTAEERKIGTVPSNDLRTFNYIISENFHYLILSFKTASGKKFSEKVELLESAQLDGFDNR